MVPLQRGDAETLYRNSIGEDPACTPAHFALASLLAKDPAKVGEAEAAYRAAIAAEPAKCVMDPQTRTHAEGTLCNLARKELGVLLIHQQRTDEAEAFLRTATGVNPNFSAAQTILGILLKDRDKLSEAETAFRAAIAAEDAFRGTLADEKLEEENRQP